MWFGLRNAPAVIQRLMQCVLAGLNLPEGPDFVSVYLDDAIVFSRTQDDHLHLLSVVIDRLPKAGLKQKPSKCHFISQVTCLLRMVFAPTCASCPRLPRCNVSKRSQTALGTGVLVQAVREELCQDCAAATQPHSEGSAHVPRLRSGFHPRD